MIAALPNLVTGQDLKRFRKQYGMKQSALADTIGVNQATVSRWEQGLQPLDFIRLRKLQGLSTQSTGISQETASCRFGINDQHWSSLIRYYRATRELSRNDLSVILDVEVSTVFRWESGSCAPSLAKQKHLRDLLFTPLDSSARFVRLRRRLAHSRSRLALLMGEHILAVSTPMKQLNQLHWGHIPIMSSAEGIYGGKLDSWLKARSAAGIFSGHVLRTRGVFVLSAVDARLMTVYPLPLEDGRILTLAFHRSLDPRRAAGVDGQFNIDHADEAVR